METAHLILSLFLLSLCAHWANGYAQDDARRSTTGRAEDNVPTESTAVATTEQSLRHPRWYKRGDHDEEHGHDENDEGMDDDDETKAISRGKIDYWGGYYDFLINEGSYKFWAVFQLATAALLVYSGFAAVYYAKVNPPASEDYDDDFLRRRRRRRSDAFLGLGPETFQRILDAVNDEFQSHRSSRLSQ